MNLVVVSNRITCARPDEPIEGGLAAALLPVVKASGAMWAGFAAQSECRRPEPGIEIEALGEGALVRIEPPAAHYRGYYDGFANSGLWPVLHCRPDLICTNGEDYRAYRAVNACIAKALLRFCQADTIFWIHDYHFLALAEELRSLGVDRPIGFFLHTPFPSRKVFATLPHHRDLVQAMASYDLIGFQTDDDRDNFADYLHRELGFLSHGDSVRADRRVIRLGTFPIGIDVEAFGGQAIQAAGRPEMARLRASLQGSALAIGVDRLDYSKGLAHRFRAFDRLFAAQPGLKGALSLLQIAVPSRIQIPAYQDLQRLLAALVGEINGRHGDVDWTPIRYVNRGFGQSTLAGLYRAARIGLVTPLNDGMNLVAKEYVAAQNPLDPGVLVLSEFAGAARQLDAAVLVNPHDVDGFSAAIGRAFAMPRAERRERWTAMMAKLERCSLSAWFSNFVAALAACPAGGGDAAPAIKFELPPQPRRVEMTAVPAH